MPEISAGDYHHQLCEQLGVALITTDLDLNIRVWNRAAARTFRASAKEMIGSSITAIIPKERWSLAERTLRRAIETGETIHFEFHHSDAHGRRRELVGIIAPVATDSGERTGASICVHDITRRIALQNELNESRKMVALGEMAGAIAHHFNNILGGMVTSIDYAQASGDSSVKTRVLEQVGQALQRATALVNGMLAFAVGDQRTSDLGNLADVISAVAGDTEKKLQGSNIDFTLALPELPVMPFPRTQVITILRNILDNGIEAMPGGGSLRLDVSLHNASVVILVEDTGCGLDEDAKSRIFEPFWTTKGALGLGPGGATGLGLAIAHGLVHMLGGTISVTSEVGKGSCFRVTMPRSDTP